MNYIQCKLVKGDMYTIAYIPSSIAVVSNKLDLMPGYPVSGGLEKGWIVAEVYTNTNHTEEFVRDHERDHKKFDY